MKEKIDLNFCFKGNRQYVHGTDIYTKLIELYNNDVKKLDIAFHGVTIKNITFYTSKPDGYDIKVTCKCIHNNEKIKLFGIENDSNINCRYEYLEEKIVENSIVTLAEENILLKTPTEYSFIEHIVAMNKALVESLYPDINGKWYFTRLQLKEPVNMSDITSLQLVLKANFQFKLTQSVIIANEIEVGYIYFSLITKES